MTKTRIAIVGLGMAAAPHVKGLAALAHRATVTGVYSSTAAKRAKFAAENGFVAYDSLDALFGDDTVDALLVLTPPNTHREIVEKAAGVGMHVLLEKPLEISTENSVALVEAAERARVKLGIVLQHRFRPISVKLAEIVQSGGLGQLVGASARLANWRPQSYYDQPGRGTKARDGGGVLLTQGIHTLDLLISVAGVPVEVSAFAATTPVHTMETEDMAVGAIHFEGGALGTINATTCAFPGFPDSVELIGTKGSARIEGTALDVWYRDGKTFRLDDGAQGGGAGADPMAFSHEHHRAVLEDFFDAIEKDRQPKVTGREALKAHRLIDAMLRSAESGRRELV